MEFLPVLFLMLRGMAFLAGVMLNGYILFVAGCRVETTATAVWFWNRALTDFIFIVFLLLRFTSFHMFSSAFLLTALSLDRCILVARPEWVRNHRTPRLAFIMVLGTWALSLGFSLRYGDLWESLNSPASTSMPFRLDEGRLKAAVAIQFLVGFLIPLALILIPTFYVVLAAKLRRNRLIQSTKPLKILLGLVPSFFLCWLPYHFLLFSFISAKYPLPLLNIGSSVACVLTYFSSWVNPIFYLTMDEEFLTYFQRARNPQTTDNSGPELAV
ncbi:chemerin chemokine-like receptor 1 [Chelydra serpentina]|uniref:Chemerin chemokine-like receptor 1 n=1 Tax=Chelydra serpentina TaxID=8475 RepID=A0A8T1S088_CHESE|nr:chemerin chemokine-like receptor 1 [Chelydra serpentina]